MYKADDLADGMNATKLSRVLKRYKGEVAVTHVSNVGSGQTIGNKGKGRVDSHNREWPGRWGKEGKGENAGICR